MTKYKYNIKIKLYQKTKERQMTLKRIILGLIVFIIFTATGVYIVNNNLQNNNIILTNNNECDTINIAEEENIYEPIKTTIPEIELTLEEEIIPEYNIPLDKDIQKYLYSKCKEYNISYELALSVIKVESNFDINSVHKNSNKTQDVGLFQINQINHKWLSEKLGITDFLDPYQNIDAGVYMLSDLMKKYENEHLVLMAYNMGVSQAKKLVSRGINSSRYSRKVIEIREGFKNINIK